MWYRPIVSGNKEPQKFEKSGFHATKSDSVDAPVIDELPVTLECTFVKVTEEGNIIGKIVNVSIDERVLGNDGKLDLAKFRPIVFEPVHNKYHVLGEAVGTAFVDGEKAEVKVAVWQRLYEAALAVCHPRQVSGMIEAGGVAAAIESAS